MAEVCLGKRNHVDTLAHYQQVLKLDPKGVLAPYAAFGVGLTYFDQAKWKEAADAFAAVGGYPGSEKLQPEALFRQGLCFQKLEQWSVAESRLADLVAKFPKDPNAVSALQAIGLGQRSSRITRRRLRRSPS